ncbi:hypothetical protein BJX99DRAFT_235667 [Aspergillus californicus]
MYSIPLILLAAGSLPSFITGAPIPSSPSSASHLTARTYNVLGGNGKTAEGWPANDHWWPDFDEMFEANRDTMDNSCTQWGVANNSDEETDNISSAIKSVASDTGVDPRFILAIVIQESNGCVRAPTSNYGVTNPGLMQSHNGVGSCNNGEVLDPCPAEQITQMIKDGTAGTSDGDGLKACLEQAGGDDVSAFYRAARIYNSGSIAASGNLGQGIATHCYSSDVANRLTGWNTGASSCEPNTIGSLNSALTSIFRFGSSTDSGSSDTDTTSSSATESEPTSTAAPTETETATSTSTTTEATSTTEAPAVTPSSTVTSTTTETTTSTTTSTHTVTESTPSATETPTAAPTTTPTTAIASATAVAVATPSSTTVPVYPYADASCTEYYTVVSGDYCLKVEQDLGVTVDQLCELNSGLKEDCTNLWLGYQYCIKA